MKSDTQVLYLDRWVSREHFCAFIYNKEGKKLVKNYDEFSDLIASGIWFAEPLDSSNVVVNIKSKRGRKCQSQQQP